LKRNLKIGDRLLKCGFPDTSTQATQHHTKRESRELRSTTTTTLCSSNTYIYSNIAHNLYTQYNHACVRQRTSDGQQLQFHNVLQVTLLCVNHMPKFALVGTASLLILLIIIITTRSPSSLRHGHPRMRVFSYR